MRDLAWCFGNFCPVTVHNLNRGGRGRPSPHGVLLCILEAVIGVPCALEVPNFVCHVLLCMLEAVDGGFLLLGYGNVLICDFS